MAVPEKKALTVPVSVPGKMVPALLVSGSGSVLLGSSLDCWAFFWTSRRLRQNQAFKIKMSEFR